MTRKRALHARMSHSTVCNTTVSTKKTLRILMKQVRQLHVTPHACKGNAPVNMNEKYVCASNQAWAWVCVIINQLSSRQLLVCVCMVVHISPSRLQERFPCTHAALHATCVLISPACEEFSWKRSLIADCTVRHSGVERSCSSWWIQLFIIFFSFI